MHILVHLDGGPATRQIIRIAAAFASRQGALLRGILTSPQTVPADEISGIKSAFLDETHGHGIGGEWLGTVASSSELGSHGFASDLIVVGQPESDTDISEFTKLLLCSARPLLSVPVAGRHETCGTRIIIAWTSGREAARSLLDSLHLLRHANRVILVCITAAGAQPNDNNTELLDFLRHHGVSAAMDTIPAGELHTGDQILNLVCEESADLLVMGGVHTGSGGKHSLGTVSAHVLRHMTVPVLISH